MSERFFELRRDSGHIPSGRQLPRTPPLTEVKRHLDYSSEDLEEADQVDPSGPDEPELHRSSDFHVPEPRAALSGHGMLKGMKGYQLTASDLDFIRAMQEDKVLRRLQAELEEVKKLLKTETVMAERSAALQERAQAELDKLPAGAELAAWARAVLAEATPRPPAGLDARRLLSMVKKEDVQRLVEEKEARLAKMEDALQRKKNEAEEREKEMAEGQMKVRSLMSEFSKLKLELEREEEVQKMLQSRSHIKETMEIKGGRRDAKDQGKHGGKEGEKDDGAEGKRPPRRRVASAKPEDANETSKTNPKTVKATRAAREAQRDKEPVQRGRGTPPTAAPPPKRRLRGQSSPGAAGADPDVGLRRSKRIANRK